MKSQKAKASSRDHRPNGPNKGGVSGTGSACVFGACDINTKLPYASKRNDQLTRGGVWGKGDLVFACLPDRL
jgi:hypothetical protein